MKAAFLVGVEEVEIREVPDPVAPVNGLVLDVAACGVCGSDLRRWREGPAAAPIVPGHEVSGIVTQVGKGVSDYAEGDLLAIAPDIHCGRCYYCQRGLYNLCDNLQFIGISTVYPGGMAEKMMLSHEILVNGIVHRLPAGASFAQGALAEPCSSVLASHHKAGTGLGDTVVVMGAGPIGCLHTIVAKARGASVIVSEPSAKRREMVLRFQPDAVVDPFAENLNDRVREMTAGVGADIVVCANPVAATHAQAVQIVRKAGRVMLFGGLPKANPTTTFDGNIVHYGEIEVVGAFSYHPTFHAMALDVLSRGVIPADLIITHSYPLEDAAGAFDMAASGDTLKVLVTTDTFMQSS